MSGDKAPPTLLVDGDLLLYRAASACEEETHWGNDVWTLSTNLKEVKHVTLRTLRAWMNALKSKNVIVCFSDKNNYRKVINPDYKGNRVNVRKPMGFRALLEWAQDEDDFPYPTLSRPGLEADDCMGIMATRPGSNCVIVSDDKDFCTVPGRFYRVGIGKRKAERIVMTEEAADAFFYTQAIAGDMTDGYSGAPGIGVDTASKLIEDGVGYELYEHELKSGKRKGEKEQRKRKVPMENPWDIVVSCYTTAGLTEQSALMNARMARILRWEDYDHEKKEPILWAPDTPVQN